ncbi:MAG: T9SS type A sorting domain-containing protein [Bacteroidetes bacterium]|nr:T9SS type A sorting domain-containing protein [Bacteroidota bacterium]
MRRLSLLICFSFQLSFQAFSQTIDCAYPILFLHGWTGNETSFQDVYTDAQFSSIWGPLTDVFHVVVNATDESHIWGSDQIPGTSDDDVLVQFVNETNNLSPGCIYAINLQNFWNEDPNNPLLYQGACDSPGFFESDSNESAILKQGYALKSMIQKVLAANPGKSKVILVGHSMGGLEAREYLQRRTPENPTGTPRWWVTPGAADGHKVAKLVTTVTPHLGSNTAGNISGIKDPDPADKDGTFDLASEAVRDMRYSNACGFLGLDDCPGVYLYGGNEDDYIDFPYPYWNYDVDCDGDESSPAVVGINIDGATQGVGDEWDGTYDNPQIPLPDNLRYTWITSDIFGDSGDGVVAWSRQWLYNGATPYPSDGTAYRLADTLHTDVFHTSANDEPGLIVRGLDEADYPAHAWEIGNDALFGGLVTIRTQQAPEGPNTTDPDWYVFTAPDGLSNDIEIQFVPHPGLAGRIDFFGTNPADYTPMTTNGSIFQTFPIGSGPLTLTLPLGSVNPDGVYYLRVIHEGIGYDQWVTPYQFTIQTLPPLPLELLAFSAKAIQDGHLLDWETALEENLTAFEVQRAGPNQEFQTLTALNPTNTPENHHYNYLDRNPLEGINYYRLRIPENDGSYSFSPVKALKYNPPFRVEAIYPNPVADQLTVDIQTSLPNAIKLEVFDATGRLIRGQTYPGISGSLSLDTQDWPAGFYVLKIRQGNLEVKRKVVK